MIVVYLKNGEKAPLPDATHVRLAPDVANTERILACFFGDQEVGQFKWAEVAGYTLTATSSLEEHSSPQAYQAWGLRET